MASSKKCPECPPEGLPGWMATFSDMVTLLLTFFILLYATSQQDEERFEAISGSIREAFGGSSRQFGDVQIQGKSPDDSPTMLDSQEDVSPFPIDFLTTDGFLNKLEVNRESSEDLNEIRKIIKEFDMTGAVNIYELTEGVKVRLKDRIYFQNGGVTIEKIQVEVLHKMIELLKKEKKWKIFIEGHSAPGERSKADNLDSFSLSAKRAEVVTRYLLRQGVTLNQISSVFYGDARPVKGINASRVEFVLRKVDLIDNPTQKFTRP